MFSPIGVCSDAILQINLRIESYILIVLNSCQAAQRLAEVWCTPAGATSQELLVDSDWFIDSDDSDVDRFDSD